MTEIKFERFKRDCGHNDTCAPSQIIYDVKVMIDGVHRATLHRDYNGRGYHLQDIDNDPIDPPVAHYRTGRQISRKDFFEPEIADLLARGFIPTPAEIDRKRAVKAEKIAKRKAEQAEAYRVNTIQQAGMYLYAALKLAQAEIHNPGAARAAGIDICDVIEQAFKQAEWTEHRDADRIEYDARYS